MLERDPRIGMVMSGHRNATSGTPGRVGDQVLQSIRSARRTRGLYSGLKTICATSARPAVQSRRPAQRRDCREEGSLDQVPGAMSCFEDTIQANRDGPLDITRSGHARRLVSDAARLLPASRENSRRSRVRVPLDRQDAKFERPAPPQVRPPFCVPAEGAPVC